MTKEEAQKVAMGLAKFSIENGIVVYDPNEELIGTNTLCLIVTRMGRTDDEIDKVVRQLKVLFLMLTPVEDIKIRYKVVN